MILFPLHEESFLLPAALRAAGALAAVNGFSLIIFRQIIDRHVVKARTNVLNRFWASTMVRRVY
jgi:hypothetical protein